MDGEKVRLEGEHVEAETLVKRLDEPGAERDGPAVTVPRLPEQDDAGVADRVEHGVEVVRRHLDGRFGNERGSVLAAADDARATARTAVRERVLLMGTSAVRRV